MSAVTNILVPIDFSEGSQAALTYARALADAVHASLSVLHVVENPYPPSAYTDFYSPPQDFFDRLEASARQHLDAALSAHDRAKYRAVLELRRGAAATEILSYLREHPEIDLVVMSTHGRGGVARLMMGSVADRIVRAAPCPVVTIRAAEATDTGAGRAA